MRLPPAIFRALAPGGIFLVIDHAAAEGAGDDVVKSLHRVEESLLRSEIEAAAERAEAAGAKTDARALARVVTRLRAGGAKLAVDALEPELAARMTRHGERPFATVHEPDLSVVVDREKARFGAWYELFPRSCAPAPTRARPWPGPSAAPTIRPPSRPLQLNHRPARGARSRPLRPDPETRPQVPAARPPALWIKQNAQPTK